MCCQLTAPGHLRNLRSLMRTPAVELQGHVCGPHANEVEVAEPGLWHRPVLRQAWVGSPCCLQSAGEQQRACTVAVPRALEGLLLQVLPLLAASLTASLQRCWCQDYSQVH